MIKLVIFVIVVLVVSVGVIAWERRVEREGTFPGVSSRELVERARRILEGGGADGREEEGVKPIDPGMRVELLDRLSRGEYGEMLERGKPAGLGWYGELGDVESEEAGIALARGHRRNKELIDLLGELARRSG